MSTYSISRKLGCSYEDAVERARAALSERGFGILTEVDVKATLKKKLDKDFKKYIILGACNPPYALSALIAEEEIGLFMPCNVVVYEDGAGAVVSAIDPLVAMSVIDNPELKGIAREVRDLLEEAVKAL